MCRQFRQNLIGSVQEVLFEEKSGQYYTGHASNYVKVYAPGENLHNQLRPVRILEIWEDGVRGEIVEG